jgi:hypothetical protein
VKFDKPIYCGANQLGHGQANLVGIRTKAFQRTPIQPDSVLLSNLSFGRSGFAFHVTGLVIRQSCTLAYTNVPAESKFFKIAAKNRSLIRATPRPPAVEILDSSYGQHYRQDDARAEQLHCAILIEMEDRAIQYLPDKNR